jgi:HAD superfamily hydrolase (TIGR01450 family)
VPHAAEAVRAARAVGLRPAFVTNNASRSPDAVAEHLNRLEIQAAPDDVVTSAQAVGRWLRRELPAGSAVLVVGTDDLAAEVRAAGMHVVSSADDEPAAVAQGLSQQTSWQDLAEAAVALRAGARWVAGNTDSTLPSTRGPLPGNGAFVAALALVTGRQPVVVGKPEPELHRASVERVGARRPLVVGDRLDTDVLGAVRGGADSLLVLTGVVTVVELLAAPVGSRPTYVARDLRGLLEPQPAVHVDLEGGTSRCFDAVARCEDRAISASWNGGRADLGPGAAPDDLPVAALRAACALAWSQADAGSGTGA